MALRPGKEEDPRVRQAKALERIADAVEKIAEAISKPGVKTTKK